MTTHIAAGSGWMTCDGGCGKTVPQRVGTRDWWGITKRPQITPTILSAKDNPSAYGPPQSLDACSAKCLSDLYEKHGDHLPLEIVALMRIEEQNAHG